MTDVELGIYAYLVCVGLFGFASFLLLGTRHASTRRLAFAMILFGGGLLAGLGRYQYRLALFGTPADGTVTAVTQRRGGEQPTVQFTTADGQPVEFRCRHRAWTGTHIVGQPVPVYYLESDPGFAVVASRVSLWQPLGFGTAVALVPFGLAGVLRRYGRRR